MVRGEGLRAFSHRSRLAQAGFGSDEHLGKPVIGILNTWSELNPCHIHLRERAEAVKRGVWQAGGFPVELPVGSMGGETFQKPTAMFYRNLLAMETEELLRSYPVDGAVLLGGCDKTTPGLLMGAASVDLPAIYVPAGPMLRGNWQGTTLGSGSDLWKYWDELRAGTLDEQDWQGIGQGLARSPGHCMTMGTASTMTSVAEVLGMTLPGAASIPAVDSAHSRMAAASGQRIVAMVWEELLPSTVLTADAYADAVTTVLALGGSTNAVIHLIAMAGRSGVTLTLDDFDAAATDAGAREPAPRWPVPDGGLLLRRWPARVPGQSRRTAAHRSRHGQRPVVEGRARRRPGARRRVIRPLDEPLSAEGGLAVLRATSLRTAR